MEKGHRLEADNLEVITAVEIIRDL